MGILWTMLGGEGGRVSRGGASPEFQARPSRAEAHEVVSGGSYSASKLTQIPLPRRLKYQRATEHLSTRVKTPLHLVRAGGANECRETKHNHEGRTEPGRGTTSAIFGGERPGSKPHRPWPKALVASVPPQTVVLSHLRPGAFPFPRRATHPKATKKRK